MNIEIMFAMVLLMYIGATTLVNGLEETEGLRMFLNPGVWLGGALVYFSDLMFKRTRPPMRKLKREKDNIKPMPPVTMDEIKGVLRMFKDKKFYKILWQSMRSL